MTDDVFEQLVADGIDAIPLKFRKALNNVAIVVADQPSHDQRRKLRLCQGQTLFGLYEGIPQTKRGANYNLVLPDKITIFKLPILASSSSVEEVRETVRHTVWHEVAHHFGLNHDQIHRLENDAASEALAA